MPEKEGLFTLVQGEVVRGEGPQPAQLMIVGEAPGREEMRQGRPFVGRAGAMLNQLLKEVGIRREEAWITNMVKRHPVRTVGGRQVTRKPTVAEINADRCYLDRELASVRPRIVLCLGTVSANVLIHRGFLLRLEHGRWFAGPDGSRLIATFHPAYVRRPRRIDYQQLLQLAREDFRAVQEALAQS